MPSASFEAARDLARAREQVRGDLAWLRHRVSKLLLRYGRVYDQGGTWTQAHRRWLAAQRFEHIPTELAYLDALAAIDGLLARRAVLDERLSLLAAEPELWPTVARLRCFRGIETLSALVLHLEIGDWLRNLNESHVHPQHQFGIGSRVRRSRRKRPELCPRPL